MVRKDAVIMGPTLQRIKIQLKDRKFRIYAGLGIIVGIVLCAEFLMFSYSILKCVRYLVLLAATFVIAWIDRHERRIPNRILLILLGIRAVLLVGEWTLVPSMGLSLLISSLMGMLIGGGLFLLAYFISRGGVGMGDVKFFAVIGTYMGTGSIMALVFMTALAAALYSIIMLILKKIKLKEEIPFAPFVLVGTILTMALGM